MVTEPIIKQDETSSTVNFGVANPQVTAPTPSTSVDATQTTDTALTSSQTTGNNEQQPPAGPRNDVPYTAGQKVQDSLAQKGEYFIHEGQGYFRRNGKTYRFRGAGLLPDQELTSDEAAKLAQVKPLQVGQGTQDLTGQKEPLHKWYEPILHPIDFYRRADTLRRWGHAFYPGQQFSNQRHATVSNFMTKEYGPSWTRAMGWGNEIQGLWIDVRSPERTYHGQRAPAFEMKDVHANEVGIRQAEEDMAGQKSP